MWGKKLTGQEHSCWMLAAMAAPVAQAAASCSWSTAVVMSSLCIAIGYGMESLELDRTVGRWIGAVQWLWMLPVISEYMHWIMYCWPNHGNYYVVPLVLLTLAAYCVSRGTETACRTGATLLLPVAVILGMVLFFSLGQIRVENLKPVWQMQTAHLINVMFIPIMGYGYGNWKGKGKLIGGAAVVAAITAGVLSLEYVRNANAPLYELSRSIQILGSDRRIESLVATAMTLGYFVLLSYFIGITANVWEPGRKRKRSIWISALFAALVFISGMRLNSRLMAVGNLTIWTVLPVLKNIAKKAKKPLDK